MLVWVVSVQTDTSSSWRQGKNNQNRVPFNWMHLHVKQWSSRSVDYAIVWVLCLHSHPFPGKHFAWTNKFICSTSKVCLCWLCVCVLKYSKHHSFVHLTKIQNEFPGARRKGKINRTLGANQSKLVRWLWVWLWRDSWTWRHSAKHSLQTQQCCLQWQFSFGSMEPLHSGSVARPLAVMFPARDGLF